MLDGIFRCLVTTDMSKLSPAMHISVKCLAISRSPRAASELVILSYLPNGLKSTLQRLCLRRPLERIVKAQVRGSMGVRHICS